MKKIMIIAVLAMALVLCAAAQATGAPQFSSALFDSGKAAMGYLASGEYERLVTLLPFSGVAPGAAEGESFAANFQNLASVQSDYAVAWWAGTTWRLAVPAQAPDSGEVEALVLTSEDGVSFDGYRYALWAQVEQAYAGSDHVLWDQEYVGDAPLVFVD